MRRLFRLATRLYPAWWRRRYSEEFEALLEDMNPGWRGLVDVQELQAEIIKAFCGSPMDSGLDLYSRSLLLSISTA